MSAARVAGLVLALALVAVTAGLSQVPWRGSGAGDAVLRLSWRTVSERIEACRAATPEEQARMAPHMRQDRVCEGRVAPFRLRVEVDGVALTDTEVRAAGAREDRPVYILREYALSPGVHAVAIRFARVVMPGGELEVDPTAATLPRFPAVVEWSDTVRLVAGEVVLVTWDGGARSLVLRRSTR